MLAERGSRTLRVKEMSSKIKVDTAIVSDFERFWFHVEFFFIFFIIMMALCGTYRVRRPVMRPCSRLVASGDARLAREKNDASVGTSGSGAGRSQQGRSRSRAADAQSRRCVHLLI